MQNLSVNARAHRRRAAGPALVAGVVGAADPVDEQAALGGKLFLGAFSRITFRLEGIEQALTADLSLNDMDEFHPKPGDTLRVAVPPERVRVFES